MMNKIIDKKYQFVFDNSVYLSPLGLGEFLGAYLFNIRTVTMNQGGTITYNDDLNVIVKFILYIFNVITWQYFSDGANEGIRWIYSWTIPCLGITLATPTRYEVFAPTDDNWDTLEGIGHWLFFSYHFKLQAYHNNYS